MTQRFYLKRNDLAPAIEAIPYDANGDVIPIADGATVVFNMRHALSGVTKVDRGTATLVLDDDDVPTLGYEWQDGDTDTAGTFYAEWEWLNGVKPQTIPNTPEDELDREPDRIEVVITEDYG